MEKNKDMKRRSTFAVLFYINRTKVCKDGLCQLLCKVSIDAEAAQIVCFLLHKKFFAAGNSLPARE